MRPSRIPYGEHPEQFGELTLPSHQDAGDAVPVVALWHGGSFERRFGLAQMRRLAADLARRGWAAWNLEYRRLGCGGGWPATFEDARAGVDHLASLDAPLDLDRAAGVGLSAGTALCLHVAARPGRVALRAAVDQAGLSDLGTVIAARGEACSPWRLLGTDAERADPAGLLPIGVPMLHVFGTGDDVVPVALAEHFSARARAAGDSSEVVTVPGDHYVHMDPASEAWRVARGWLEARLGDPRPPG